MEELSEALERLTSAGYNHDFRATSEGLRALGTGHVYDPESLIIDEVVRFEGITDPADESILFALRSDADGLRGTYAVAYGPAMEPLDVKMVRRLARTV